MRYFCKESFKTKNMNKIYNLITFLNIKKTSHFFLVLIGLLFTQISKSQTYCSASATSVFDDEIFNVTFGTLNNTTACGDVGGGASIASQYNDYTSVIAAPVVSLGGTYPLSVTVGQCDGSTYSGYVGVWIDYNGNGDFTDAGENVFMSSSTTFVVAGTLITAPGGVTIPFSAIPGTTRMRIIAQESGIPAPCGTFSYGEVEDYNITILSPFPLDLGVSALLKPVSTKKCFGNDTIVATVKNYGSATVDFATNPTTVTVRTTGPIVNTYTLPITSGTIASTSSENYTITTSFNMSTLGTYIFKAYTTVTGDGSALNDTINYSVTKAPYFTTTALPNDSVCLGIPVNLNANYSPLKTVGTGLLTNSSTSYPAPYGNFYWGAKNQFLFLASELTAAGLSAGNITSLSFDATNLNSSASLTNFNIAMAASPLTAITTFTTSGLTTVFTATTYSPNLGINTHVLSTPFIWDGISNIIIETCFNNSSYTSNVSVKQSTTPFSSSVYYRADASGVCATTSGATSAMQRPNISFGQPAVVSYSWTPSIGLSSTSISSPTANLSASQTYTVAANMSGCLSYDTIRVVIKPTPTPHLGNDSAVCTLPLILNASTTADNFLWNTGSTSSVLNITSTGTYWVKATNSNGCTNTDTVKITLGTYPIVTLGSDTAFCVGKTITLYAGNPGSTYLWNTGATTPTIAVGTAGTYSVVVTNTSSCHSSDIIGVTSKPNPSVSLVFTGQTRFCPTETIRPLTEGSPSGGTYIGSGVVGSNFNANLAGQGTYIIYYSYTAPNGCSNQAKDTLIVNACVGVEELVDNFGLNVYPNPNSGEFTLEINSNSNIDGIISITSIDGKLVYNESISGDLQISKGINISNLSNGIYYLNVKTTNTTRTYKLLKQ